MEAQVSAGGAEKVGFAVYEFDREKVIMREGEDLGRHSQAERAEE